MTLSTLPLSYCTNVHPGRSVDEVLAGLSDYTLPVQKRFANPLAAGLWLAAPVIEELQADPQKRTTLRETLSAHRLVCYTLNAFPFGDFHSARVKERVYLPDWTDVSRLDYTLACAQILSDLLPPGTEGSISTVPLGSKLFDQPADFMSRCCEQLIRLAHGLNDLHDETGCCIRLAIEPEPFCVLERTDEVLRFFDELWKLASQQDCEAIVRRHIGVCYDVCHQSVEFEDIARSITSLNEAGIRINKVHITCALQLPRPGENAAGREALERYIEPRYLHQTMGRLPSGEILRSGDLTDELWDLEDQTAPWHKAVMWRIHFHVPVNAERMGPLETTRADLKTALQTVAQLDYAPHLEVETYTWEVLPGRQTTSLVDGLAQELNATSEMLQDIASGKK
ncbi:MAG: metabolite traffic protein EboE [Planctomycetota bacterium]|nr:metabolite traffic protein EboE [Planctomycetota bacterium]MDA1213425.1 metabolite traffic protein EboE [Planctomycetota bacterium]